ncbi:hypothetical protein AMK59_3688, partial [Oryctes borbonicus]
AESVITQESTIQTSPEVSDLQQFIEQEKSYSELEVQTSPEPVTETAESGLQVVLEEPKIEEPKPEVFESSSQVDISVTETITQTSTPEKEEIVTTDSSMQTIIPQEIEVAQEATQTVSVEIPRSESAMQTHVTETEEHFVQTISPEVPEVQTAEFTIQTRPFDIEEPHEESIQTTPPIETPIADDTTQTSLPFYTAPPQEEKEKEELLETPAPVEEKQEELVNKEIVQEIEKVSQEPIIVEELTPKEVERQEEEIPLIAKEITQQETPEAVELEILEPVITEPVGFEIKTIEEEAVQGEAIEPVEPDTTVQEIIESKVILPEVIEPETYIEPEIQMLPHLEPIPKIPSASEEFLKAEVLAQFRPETTDTTSQTAPVIVKDIHETTPPAKSPEELEYEIFIKTSVVLPEDETSTSEASREQSMKVSYDAKEKIPDSQEPELQPTEIVSESESSDSEPLVKVTVDGVPITEPDLDKKKRRRRKRRKPKKEIPTAPEELKDTSFLSTFTRQDETLQQPKELYSAIAKKRSHSPLPPEPEQEQEYYEPESIVVSKIITDIHKDNIKDLVEAEQSKKQRPEDSYSINVSITIPEDTPSATPTEFTRDSASVSDSKDTDIQSPHSSIDDFLAKERLESEEYQFKQKTLEKEDLQPKEINKEDLKPNDVEKEKVIPKAIEEDIRPEVAAETEGITSESVKEKLEEVKAEQDITLVEELKLISPEDIKAEVSDFTTKQEIKIVSQKVKPTAPPEKLLVDTSLKEIEDVLLPHPSTTPKTALVEVAAPEEAEVSTTQEKLTPEQEFSLLTEARIVTAPADTRIEKELLSKESAKIDPNMALIEHERTMDDQQPKKPKTPKHKAKGKHPPSVTIEEVIPVPVTDTPITPGTDISIQPKKPKTPKHKAKGKHPPSITIEEVIPVPVTDTPITPGTDISISPPDLRYSSVTTVWEKPIEVAEQPEKQDEGKTSETHIEHVPIQELNIKWNQTQSMERAKNLQNAKKTTHLSDILYLATLNEVVTDETIEERNNNINKYLDELKVAVTTGDSVIVQKIVITTVETITSWLDTIEYRIYMNRQQTSDGPSIERVEELNNLKTEINNVETNIGNLRSEFNNANNLCNEEDSERIQSYITSLQNQVRIIEQVTEEHEQLVVNDLHRWQEFITGVEAVSAAINELKSQYNNLLQSEISPQIKLNELESLESINNELMIKSLHLVATARSIIRDFSNKEVPQDVYMNLEVTRQLEHYIKQERDKALQLLSIAEEYDQALKEFISIVELADALIESPIAVNNLEHLEDEMQNHRKFFVNLSHCRAILESLEENLDPETRNMHSELHQNLHQRASIILDQAAGRFQQMSLAASKWTVLEQGMREEQKWLQVAQQRVPDLSTVTSADYDQYINLYQSLSLDIGNHHTKLVHLANVAHKLQEKITCTGLDQIYVESLDIILRLQEDVNNNLKRLVAFRESWVTYNVLSDKLEYFLRDAELGLEEVEVPLGSPVPNPGHMRQFWELKAQTEVHNNIRLEATNTLEKSLQVVPVQDEMVQRKFHADLLDQWQKFTDRINSVQNAVIENISAPDAPINQKFNILEQELLELSAMLDSLQGIIKTEEELNLYIERLQTMSIRVETIETELSKLGLLSTMDSEKVGRLLAMSKQLKLQINEELDGGYTLRDRLQAIDKGLERVRKYHANFDQTLDQCEGASKLGSEAVEKAVNECYEVGEGLATVWQDLMSLRQLLHTLPMRLRVTVSPTKVERDISQLQDAHSSLEKKCMQILSMLKSRLALWQRFERQLEMVQQSVQEADFMMELLTVQGTVDYDRLLKATERLESVSGDLVSRESLIAELKAVAKPLTESCAPEISTKVEAAVAEAETAWNETCNNLKELCSKYQHAADLWKQYRDTTDLVREWIDTNIETVNNLDPEEAVNVVNVSRELFLLSLEWKVSRPKSFIDGFFKIFIGNS